MAGWPIWLCLIVGFIFGACFGFIVGIGIADNYWRKNLIKKQKLNKQYFAAYEVEKENNNEHDNPGKSDWW